MLDCPVHGFAGSLLYSSDLLEVQPDGKLPEILTIEVKGGFFYLNLSPKAVASYAIQSNPIPFDDAACDLIDELPEMCGSCFAERRRTLEAQQAAAPGD
jgi:hypothetical protein